MPCPRATPMILRDDQTAGCVREALGEQQQVQQVGCHRDDSEDVPAHGSPPEPPIQWQPKQDEGYQPDDDLQRRGHQPTVLCPLTSVRWQCTVYPAFLSFPPMEDSHHIKARGGETVPDCPVGRDLILRIQAAIEKTRKVVAEARALLARMRVKNAQQPEEAAPC